ncbi:MAG: aspartyl/asparaginyl beta-hydroxylase domain-containing protein [Pseudomonadota bacterium]
MNASPSEAVKAQISAAQTMLRSGDGSGALQLLEQAVQENPNSSDLYMNVAMAHRATGSLPAAVNALNRALAIEPYSFLALLSKGSILEQMNQPKGAAEVYKNALKIAPAAQNAPSSLKAPLARAQEVVEQQALAMADFLHQELAPLQAKHKGDDNSRFLEAVDVLTGVKKVYNAEPIQFHYPRLPAIPFFDRSYFPWMGDLEAATDDIRGELTTLLEEGLSGFSPYVAYAPGTPENQFKALNHNNNWSSLWLWRDGHRQEEAMARCPKTTSILDELPMADQPGFAPTALFSALAPRTKIPPHTGSTNVRLLVHLPLVLPGPAGFRVGNDVREWKMGEAWAFDDTIEHEAWNDADETRVIMIFDVWNPLLSEAEKDLIRQLLITHRSWMESD